MHKKMQFDLPANIKSKYSKLDELRASGKAPVYVNGNPIVTEEWVNACKELNVELEKKSAELVAEFGGDCDISWCDDGSIVLSTAKAATVIDNAEVKCGLSMKDTCREDIKHRVPKNLDGTDGEEPDHLIIVKKNGVKEKTLKKGGVKKKYKDELTQAEIDAIDAMENNV